MKLYNMEEDAPNTPGKKHRSVLDIPEISGYLTPEQIYEKYVAPIRSTPGQKATEVRDKALISALYGLGIRKAELARIKRKQVIIEEEFLVVKDIEILKQKHQKLLDKAMSFKGRMAPFTRTLWAYIEHKRPEESLFDINKERIWQIVKAKTGMWPHYFRSQHISYLANELGLNTVNLKDLTGHSTTSELQKYAHSTWKQYKEQLSR